MRIFLIAFAIALPLSANAQVYKCAVLKHWRNAVLDRNYISDNPEPTDGATFTLDFPSSKIFTGSSGTAIDGKVVAPPGANSIGMLGGGVRELAIYTVFPNFPDPQGGVLGSVLRINDNDYMPKGTMMTRLSCKRS